MHAPGPTFYGDRKTFYGPPFAIFLLFVQHLHFLACSGYHNKDDKKVQQVMFSSRSYSQFQIYSFINNIL